MINREESRKLKKQGVSDFSIRLMEEDRAYKRGLEKGFKDGMREAIDIMFYITAYTLNYKLDLGRVRLPRTMRWIYNNIDSFRTGHLTHEDMENIRKEMKALGVVLKKDV
jgi:hypothetical protein